MILVRGFWMANSLTKLYTAYQLVKKKNCLKKDSGWCCNIVPFIIKIYTKFTIQIFKVYN